MRRSWFLVICVLMGCTARPGPAVGDGTITPEQLRVSQGYALLYELVSKQSGLDKVFVLGGGVSDETRALILEIDAASEQAAVMIPSFAESDPWIDLRTSGLPTAEVESRQSAEASITRRLLFAGKEFELRLLLSQAEATGYCESLARSIASMDHDPRRRKWLSEFADSCERYARRVEGRLAVRKGDPQ